MATDVQALRLRPLRKDDEAAFAAAHAVMTNERFTFGIGYTPGMPWDAYLTGIADRRHGRNLPPRFVPGTFLVADVAGQIVGRTSIRFELNDFLLREGGTSATACFRSAGGAATRPRSSGRAWSSRGPKESTGCS